MCLSGVTRCSAVINISHIVPSPGMQSTGGTPIPSDCFHFFCSELLNSTRFYSHSRPRRSIIQRNLWWRHNGAVTGLFQCINCSQFRNISSWWNIWGPKWGLSICPLGYCESEMINKRPSLIHLMVVMRADGRTIPGIHEACHEERMMSLCHDAHCDHPPVSIVHQECLPTSYNNIYNIPNI